MHNAIYSRGEKIRRKIDPGRDRDSIPVPNFQTHVERRTETSAPSPDPDTASHHITAVAWILCMLQAHENRNQDNNQHE
jgi:hypothetical protein